jgi:WD40 repeat protein
MKIHLLRTIAVGLFTALGAWCVAAPAPPAGRPKEIASFQAHHFGIRGLAFSPDGKSLASCAGKGEVKRWNVARSQNLLDIRAHPPNQQGGLGIVYSVAFSPDGKTLASCGDDRKIKLWDVATSKNTGTYKASPAPPLIFSPDGKTLVCGYERFDLETGINKPLVEKITGMWPVVAFDPKGKLLVATSLMYPNAPSFVLWDAKTGIKAVICKGLRKVVHCYAFSPDGKTVVSTEGDYEGKRWAIRLWDVATGKNTATFEQPDLPYRPLFSPDGKVLAVSYKPDASRNDYPGMIRLLEVSSGKVLATLKGHKRPIGCQTFSPNGRLLATGSLDGVIKIWSLPNRYIAD